MATGRIPTTANSPLTAKGDLFTFSTGSAKLAVGSNGDTLVADSSTTTGLRYNPTIAAGKNAIINGGMDVWQRGTSVALTASSSNYVTDRFYSYRGTLATGGTVSRQLTSDTTNLPNIQYCARVQRDSGNTSTQPTVFVSDLETVNSIPYAGKTVTLSFYARAGANYSATSNALSVTLFSGTGTDQAIRGGYTNQLSPISQTATLTTTWQRFSYSASIGSNVTQLGLYILTNPTGTAGANDYFEITGVQLELGSVATAFSRAGGTIQGELAACQRYYYKWSATAYSALMICNQYTSTASRGVIFLPTAMRIAPTITSSASSTWSYGTNTGVSVSTALSLDTATPTTVSLAFTTGSSTAGYSGYIQDAGSGTASIQFSSEL
jgi:hypothetical protein